MARCEVYVLVLFNRGAEKEDGAREWTRWVDESWPSEKGLTRWVMKKVVDEACGRGLRTRLVDEACGRGL